MVRRLLAAVAVAAVMAAMAVPVAAAFDPGLEDDFRRALNAERAAAGLPALASHPDLVDDARAHSRRMMDQDHLHHNPDLARVTTGWLRLGENVGVGPGVASLHQAFMDSPPHRDNILGEWHYVGIGVERESATKIWVTVVFMEAWPGSEPEPPAPPPLPDLAEAPGATVGLVDPSQGLWYLQTPTGRTVRFYYGNPGDYPMMGDWDCDGVDTPGLYRQSDGYVYVRNSNTAGIGDVRFFFGNPSDVPIAGDFDGDGCDTVSLYRPSEGRVYIINRLGSEDRGLGAADFYYSFGGPGDVPLAADFDGDGADSVAMYVPSQARVRIKDGLSDAAPVRSAGFGDIGDRPVAADWSGTGRAGLGAYRPGARAFHLDDEAFMSPGTLAPGRAEADWLPVAGEFGLTG